ncbi:uncharacterized protein EI97DRAFT_472846 [Westerdykella ornata]|uniref:Glycoside hydrolase 131 catalytic N-terminal domain-containing protein n=1 Tax=Westerdykella ornata TaxID=318751 RepID=A0A6A6JXS0_WESOR|nr:uncharacterized protein EI97DRAFT_472846 [Westerdykella ornata]KAF2281420.1 hypothetical protein EI97DRAFT_472846 [Westerdykella ornata]
MYIHANLAILALAATTTALPNQNPKHPKPGKQQPSRIKCPIIFDGRIPIEATLLDFDSPERSPYNTQYVKGENLTWSSIIQFPASNAPGQHQHINPSRFDEPRTHKPFEVTIDNNSLFRTGSGLQTGFRRAGLLLKNDSNPEGSDAADKGVVTFHWSVLQNPKVHPLNLTHEYMNVWHERADYAGNQFTFSTGLLLKQDGGDGVNTRKKREQFRVQDRNNKIVFETGIQWSEWQNWAVKLDHAKGTLQVFYSEGDRPLNAVTRALENDNTGGGQLQLGIAKKPTETETVVWDGYHEVMKHKEGQIYSGVFVEDSTDGCISV